MTKAENIHTALAAAQAEIENPPKEREAKVKSKRTGAEFKYMYADISDVLKTVLPVLSKHGVAVIQETEIQDGQMLLKTTLAHGASDTSTSSMYPVCSLNGDHQQMGGALTYARRYSLCTMVGVAPAEDLDGADAAKSGDGDQVKMSAMQAKKELNWNQIVGTIRNAASLDKLAKIEERITANKGTWPSSFITSALEEIDTKREDLEYIERVRDAADNPANFAELLEECGTEAAVTRLRRSLQDMGEDIEALDDQFTMRLLDLQSE